MTFLSEQLQLVASGTSWIDPLSSLLGAFVLGQLLAWTYERTYAGLSYSRGFSHTLVLVSICAAILVLSMSYSIFAGLGLFGVLSMIRFRTDLKTSRDLVFVMGSACLGVSCGVNAWTVALLGGGLLCGVALYLAAGPFGSRARFDGVLRFRVEDEIEDADRELKRLLEQYCRRIMLLSSVEQDGGRSIEHVYQVKFFKNSDRSEIMEALRERIQAHDTRLMLQDSSAEY
ncbi:MAG: DUF4956 domain-containing protein [Opitutales bacterium]|jgi:hypothetical protein|nr:DUF4956 domain-containing protein [Opitutales bacterium]